MEEADAAKEQFKRIPAEEKSLSELGGREKRVAVIGTIVSLQPAELKGVLSDGSGEAFLEFPGKEKFSQAKEGSTVRVIGKPRLEEKPVLQVETVHLLQNFDKALFERVKALEKKVLK